MAAFSAPLFVPRAAASGVPWGSALAFRNEHPAAAGLSLLLPQTPASGGRPSSVLGQRARVLAVDDEVLLLTAYRRMLRRRHDVETANNGRDALALLEQDRRFDVILCDLLMPYFSGMELHREVGVRWPELTHRFLFVTGGAFTPNARRFLEERGSTWIEKPVDLSRLLRVIDEKVAAENA